LAGRRPGTIRAGTDQGKEECLMKLGMTHLRELKEMKEKMDLVWKDLLERNPEKSEEDFEWSENLPRSAGMGRSGSLKVKKLG
jgi:hypothetical protein